MPLLLDEHDLLFTMTPRTGCTAIAEGVLLPRFDATWLPAENVTNAAGKTIEGRKHITVPKMLQHGILTPERRAELHVFTSVRNPFDSLVSVYEKQRTKYVPLLDDPDSWVHRGEYADLMKVAAEGDFDGWLEAKYARRGRRRRRPAPEHLQKSYVLHADTILRYETLQEDFTHLFEQRGIQGDTTIPRINVTDRGADWRSYYSKSSRRLVERMHAPDLERFGYAFER